MTIKEEIENKLQTIKKFKEKREEFREVLRLKYESNNFKSEQEKNMCEFTMKSLDRIISLYEQRVIKLQHKDKN